VESNELKELREIKSYLRGIGMILVAVVVTVAGYFAATAFGL
jgi:hypothetical protein